MIVPFIDQPHGSICLLARTAYEAIASTVQLSGGCQCTIASNGPVHLNKNPRRQAGRGSRTTNLAGTFRGQGLIWLWGRDRSGGAQIIRRGFSGPPICDDLVGDLLPLAEAVEPRTFDRTDVHKDILAAIIRLNKAKTLLAVEPLYGSLRHVTVLSIRV